MKLQKYLCINCHVADIHASPFDTVDASAESNCDDNDNRDLTVCNGKGIATSFEPESSNKCFDDKASANGLIAIALMYTSDNFDTDSIETETCEDSCSSYEIPLTTVCIY